MYYWTKSLNYYYDTTWYLNSYYFEETYYYLYVYVYTYNYTTGYWHYDNVYYWDDYFKLYTEDYKYNLLWYWQYDYSRDGYFWWTYDSFYNVEVYSIGNVNGNNGSDLHSEFTNSYGYFSLISDGPDLDASTIVSFMDKFSE
jgi:hypothetical protein